MKIRAVIFDLDGTLLDTTEEIHYIFNQLLLINDLPTRSQQFYKDTIGKGIDHLLKRCLPEKFDGDYGSMLEQAKKLYSINLNKKARVFEGVPDVLDLLSEKNVRMGIITNKMHHLALRCVDRFFDKYELKTIGAEYLYPKKPDPDSALSLAQEFGYSSSEVLFIGDSSVDMVTAKNAGMISAGVLWGNGTCAELEGSGADMVFESPRDLFLFMEKI